MLFALLIESVVCTGPPEGVTLAGENAHVTAPDPPLHANETAWLKPFTGVTVRVVVPLSTDPTVTFVMPEATVKSGGGAAMPVPVKATDSGESAALSEIDTEACRLLALVGEKLIEIVHEPPAVTAVPQVFV